MTNNSNDSEQQLTEILYVIEYDNSSGYPEWAGSPAPTPEGAWENSGLCPSQPSCAGYDAQLHQLTQKEIDDYRRFFPKK